MGYTTYTPDVVPSFDGVDREARRRRWLWGVSLLVYVLFSILLIWWLTRPSSIYPPLASVPLSSSTEIRLLGGYHGSRFETRDMPDIENRFRTNQRRFNAYFQSADRKDCYWLVFSKFDRAGAKFSNAKIASVEVVDADGNVTASSSQTTTHSMLLTALEFPIFPRRSPEVDLRITFSDGGRGPVTMHSVNPFYAAGGTRFVAKALPQVEEDENARFEVSGVKIVRAKRGSSANGSFEFVPDLKVSLKGKDPNSYNVKWKLFDPLGNEVRSGVLPDRNEVWGLKVKAVAKQDFSYSAERILPLGKVKVQTGQFAVSFEVPARLKEMGVRDLIALGPGLYRAQVGKLYDSSGGRALTPVHLTGFRSFQLTGVGLLVTSSGDTVMGDQWEPRLVVNGTATSLARTVTAEQGGERTECYGLRTPSSSPATGSEVGFEIVFPILESKTFYFESPPFPAPKVEKQKK